jgi:hypothetical protein
MQTSAADGWEGELERWLAPFLCKRCLTIGVFRQ